MNTPRHILATNFLAIPRAYFEEVASPSLQKAQQKTTPETKSYTIAGKTILVHYYGDTAHEAFSLAFSHHEPSSEKPDLVIHAWDTSASGELMPPPWSNSKFEKNKLDEDFFGIYVSGEESLNFYNPKTQTGYFWVHDAKRMPDWSLGAPFRTILHWFLNDQGIYFLHGAVVGQHGKSVLLTARSGSGKSTTSLSSLLSGMDYVGDDYVAITDQDPIIAHSLYSSAKVTRKGLELFPELASHVWNPNFGEREKAVMFLSKPFEQQIKPSLPLSAILLPRITGGTTEIVPATKIEALVAAAPTTLLQLPLAETNKIAILKKIIEKVPCYFLNLGTDIRDIPSVIKRFLEEKRAN